MTYFLHQPTGIFLRTKEELLSVGEELPVGNYMVDKTALGEYFLNPVTSFTRPPKLYGTVTGKAKRILSTFQDRAASTGVLLSGEMGSGKTMLLRELSILGAEVGVPTIIVAAPHFGPDFNKFIQTIDVPAIVMLDEFEKVYDTEGQEALLTLLDGVFPTKKMFVLTCNSVWRIDEHMINRPGRIFYHLKYKGLENEFVNEYCLDVLKNKDRIPQVEHVAKQFYAFNFDMLKALVEEMNRYDLDAADAAEMLNMTPSASDDEYYDFEVFIGDDQLDPERFGGNSENYIHGKPLTGERMTINFYGDEDEDNEYAPRRKSTKPKAAVEGKKKYGRMKWTFTASDLVKVEGRVYTFEKDGATIVLTRRQQIEYNLRHAF